MTWQKGNVESPPCQLFALRSSGESLDRGLTRALRLSALKRRLFLARGASPWDLVAPVDKPRRGGSTIDGSAAPSGLIVRGRRPVPRGLRPWLTTFAPFRGWVMWVARPVVGDRRHWLGYRMGACTHWRVITATSLGS